MCIRDRPQAVPNSFADWMNEADVDFVITHPEGYEPVSYTHLDVYKRQSYTDSSVEDTDSVLIKSVGK